MSFLSRLFGMEKPKCEALKPNENVMKDLMGEAKRQNREAANMLTTTADRQVKDAEMVRQVIHDMLVRIDNPKVKRLDRKAAR